MHSARGGRRGGRGQGCTRGGSPRRFWRHLPSGATCPSLRGAFLTRSFKSHSLLNCDLSKTLLFETESGDRARSSRNQNRAGSRRETPGPAPPGACSGTGSGRSAPCSCSQVSAEGVAAAPPKAQAPAGDFAGAVVPSHSRGLALASDPSPVQQRACGPGGEAGPGTSRPAPVLGKPGGGRPCCSPSGKQAFATSEVRADHSWRQTGSKCHVLSLSPRERNEAAMPEASRLSFRPHTPP